MPFPLFSPPISSLFVRLISHQPTVLFSQNKPATSNQPAVLFSHSKSAPAISHQRNEQAEWTQLSLFLFYKQVLSFLCGSSHHITDREKDVYICICYLLTCVEGGDTPPKSPIFPEHLLLAPLQQKFFDRES
jgi:hypothetical protein